MKLLLLFALVAAVAMFAGGCVSSLTHPAQAQSLPVQFGAATTNQTEAVAWLELARQVNRTANITPTQGSVDAVLGGLIALASVTGGWLTRHHAAKPLDRKPPP